MTAGINPWLLIFFTALRPASERVCAVNFSTGRASSSICW